MQKIIILCGVIIYCIQNIYGCTFDKECTINGVVQRCVNSSCVAAGVECTQDKDCLNKGSNFNCLNAKCIQSNSCVFDKDCTSYGSDKRCLNGQCQVVAAGSTDECTKDIDCRVKGIYFKCSNAKCVPSKHKTCLTDEDCKKNLWHTTCKKNHCT